MTVCVLNMIKFVLFKLFFPPKITLLVPNINKMSLLRDHIFPQDVYICFKYKSIDPNKTVLVSNMTVCVPNMIVFVFNMTKLVPKMILFPQKITIFVYNINLLIPMFKVIQYYSIVCRYHCVSPQYQFAGP